MGKSWVAVEQLELRYHNGYNIGISVVSRTWLHFKFLKSKPENARGQTMLIDERGPLSEYSFSFKVSVLTLLYTLLYYSSFHLVFHYLPYNPNMMFFHHPNIPKKGFPKCLSDDYRELLHQIFSHH